LEQVKQGPNSITTAKGYTGHEQTDPSGLIYMQARFYAPWYGRFLSPDPARDQHFEETQSWNIYSYVRNNPVTHIDPNGMEDYPIADMPQMRVLSLTQSGIPAARAEGMVAQEQQQRTVAGVTATAVLATGGFATSATGVGMVARVSAGLAAARDTIKEVVSKAGNALGNLTSKGNSQPASDPLTKVREVINSASPMEPTSKGVGQGGLQNVQQTFQGLAKSLGVELQPGQTSFQAGNIRVGQHIPPEWDEEKVKSKKRTFALNATIRDSINSSLGKVIVMCPYFEKEGGISKSQGDKKGKALAALDHYSTIHSDQFPEALTCMVKAIYPVS
jgi:RHS repeat-associated protein